MDDLTKALVSFVLGAAGSYMALVSKVKKDLEAAYDKDLRKQRLAAYARLWAHLEPLAKYGRPAPVTHTGIRELSETLRHWYFAEGGIFMSDETRDAYFSLQDALTALLDRPEEIQRELSTDEFEAVRKSGSWLRTWTTRDVGTRRKPMLGGEPSA